MLLCAGCHHLAVTTFFIMGYFRKAFLFCDQKRKRKKSRCSEAAAWRRTTSAAIPQSGPARALRAIPGQGARPLGTPKRRSKRKKAKPCRSAARFLTLFSFSPIAPSGAKCNLRLPAAQRPPCVKGAVTEGDWGIVTLPIHRLSLARSQSLRHGCRRATSLYTREAFWLS